MIDYVVIDYFYALPVGCGPINLFFRPKGVQYKVFGGGSYKAKADRWIVQRSGTPQYQSPFMLAEFSDEQEALTYFQWLRQRADEAGELVVPAQYPPNTTHYMDVDGRRTFYSFSRDSLPTKAARESRLYAVYLEWEGVDTVHGVWKLTPSDFNPNNLRPIGEIE